MHGSEDDVAPLEHTKRFTNIYPNLAKLVIFEGTDHRFKKEGELDRLTGISLKYLMITLKIDCQNILNFNSNTAYPIMSMLRVDKYKNKGYSISKSEFLRVLLTCMTLKINTIDELKEQLGGMYGLDFTKILKNVEVKEDGQVNLVEVVEKLKDLYLEEDYFKGIPEDQRVSFADVDGLIESILSRPSKYLEINDTRYRINTYKQLTYFEEIKDDKKYEKVSAEDYFRDNKFYKFVELKDDKLVNCLFVITVNPSISCCSFYYFS
jgi:hypothetical protein